MIRSAESKEWGRNGEDTLLDYLFQTGAIDTRTPLNTEGIDHLWNEYGAFRQHDRLVFEIHFLRRSSRFIGSQAVITADNNGVEVSLPGLGLGEQQRIDRALALWRADERIATPDPYQDFIHIVSHHDENTSRPAGGMFRAVINMIHHLQQENDSLQRRVEGLERRMTRGSGDP